MTAVDALDLAGWGDLIDPEFMEGYEFSGYEIR